MAHLGTTEPKYWPAPPPWWLGWLHWLPHSQYRAAKEDVGEFHFCRWEVVFRPDLTGAGWHLVPNWDACQEMLKSTTPHEAMAALRTYEK